MKRLIFIFILSLFSICASSQVRSFDGNKMIGRFVSFSNNKVSGEILFFGNDSGGQYVWTYFNVSASDNPFINSRGIIRFNGNETSLDNIYEALKDVIDSGDRMKVILVGTKQLKVYPIKEFGKIKAKIIVSNDGYFYLSEKQLDKLFGR